MKVGHNLYAKTWFNFQHIVEYRFDSAGDFGLIRFVDGWSCSTQAHINKIKPVPSYGYNAFLFSFNVAHGAQIMALVQDIFHQNYFSCFFFRYPQNIFAFI